MDEYVEIEHREDWIYANGVKLCSHIPMEFKKGKHSP